MIYAITAQIVSSSNQIMESRTHYFVWREQVTDFSSNICILMSTSSMWEHCQWEVENNAYQSIRWMNAHWLNASKIFKQTFEPSSSWHRWLVWSKLRNAVWMHGFQSKTIVNYRPIKFNNPHFKMLFGWMVSPLNLLLYWIKTVEKNILLPTGGLENYTRNIGLDSSRRLDSSRSTPLDSPEEPRLGGAGRSRRDSSEADPDAIHQRGRRWRHTRAHNVDPRRELICSNKQIHGDGESLVFQASFPLDQHLSLLSLCNDKCWARFLGIFLLILISPCVLCDL